MELGRIPLHQMCWNSSQSRRAHYASQVCELGHLDTGTGGESATDGKLPGTGSVRGPAAGRIQATTNGCCAGEFHPGQVRTEEVCGQGVGSVAIAQGNLILFVYLRKDDYTLDFDLRCG